MVKRAVLLLVFLIGAASDRAAATDWTVRLAGGITDYSRTSFSSYSLGFSELKLDGGYALALAGEYRRGQLLGLELSVARIALDAQSRAFEIRGVGTPPRPVAVLVGSDSGDFSLQPIALTVLFHPLHRSRSDLYFGPQLAWVNYDIGLEGLPDRDAEPAYGAKIGWEWQPVTDSPWSVGLVYQFLDVQHEGVERDQYTGLVLNLLSLVVSHRSRSSH